MIKKSKFLLLFLCLSLFITSCGSNLLKGLDGSEEDEDLESLISEASTTEDYQNIISLTDNVINSTTASTEEKQEAYLTKAEAILGKNGVTPLDLFAELATSAGTDGASTDSADNVLSVLNVDADLDELLAASAAFSQAEAIGTENVSEDQQLMSGIVNLLIPVKVIQDTYTIADDGSISAKDNGKSEYENLEALISLGDDGGDEDISDYTERATSGFLASNTLDSDQQKVITELNTAVASAVTLYNGASDGDSVESDLSALFEGIGKGE